MILPEIYLIFDSIFESNFDLMLFIFLDRIFTEVPPPQILKRSYFLVAGGGGGAAERARREDPTLGIFHILMDFLALQTVRTSRRRTRELKPT